MMKEGRLPEAWTGRVSIPIGLEVGFGAGCAVEARPSSVSSAAAFGFGRPSRARTGRPAEPVRSGEY